MKLKFRFWKYTISLSVEKSRLIIGGNGMNEGLFDVRDIANWFLNKEPMSHKKLQKLCYYAQAWFYTLSDEKLINDDFKAWVHGPVSPILYQHYKGSGWSKLNLSDDAKLPQLTTEQEELLESVWLTYGDMTANALEVLTHNGQQIHHYGFGDKFRIHGIIEEGRFKVIRLDPNHKVHK